MSYESKLIVVNEDKSFKVSNKLNDGIHKVPFGEKLMEIYMASVDSELLEVFTEEANSTYALDYEGGGWKVDCYGKRLTSADIDTVIDALIRCNNKEEKPYRRYTVAINTLRSFLKDDWNELKVYHYGY